MKIIIKTKPDMEKALVLKNVYFCGATFLFLIMDLCDTKIYQTVVYVEHMIHFANDSSFNFTGWSKWQYIYMRQ